MGWNTGRNPHDRVELKLDNRLLRADQMAYVWRIERPAENADASGRYYNLTCPEPSTTYLYVHSSRRPIGPRA